MHSHSLRIVIAVLATISLAGLAGCSAGAPSGTSPSASPSASDSTMTSPKPVAGGAASPLSSPTPPGNAVQADGSVNVCNGLTLAKVKAITGLHFTGSAEGDPDSFLSGYTTYSCIFYGADPSTSSVVVYVNVGDANQVFDDNAAGVKDTLGWGPIDGVGDRAEGDGIHILDVLWGSRYVISVVDNTENSDLGVKNMAALATAVHEAIGE